MSFNGNLQPSSDTGEDLTTKGDVHGYSTENTRVPVGTDGHVLTARASNSYGIAWEAAGGGSEINKFTSASTFTPTAQTGNISIGLDGTLITAGSLIVVVDSSTDITIAAGDNAFRSVSPSSSLTIQSSSATGMNNFSYDSKDFSVASQETVPLAVFFKTDGTAMYVSGNTGYIYQYTLSTPFDVSTASYASKSFDTSSQDSTPAGLAFKSDGTVCWVMGKSADVISQYTLSSAWDISTASYASKQFSVATQENIAQGIWVSSDGTKFYICGGQNDTVYQYTMSTPYDISTGSYASKSFSVASQDTNAQDLQLSSDGVFLYVMGSVTQKVYQYTMSTPYDVSTASYNSKFLDCSSQDSQTLGLYVNIGENRLYMAGANNDKVYQYSGASYAGTSYATVFS